MRILEYSALSSLIFSTVLIIITVVSKNGATILYSTETDEEAESVGLTGGKENEGRLERKVNQIIFKASLANYLL